MAISIQAQKPSIKYLLDHGADSTIFGSNEVIVIPYFDSTFYDLNESSTYIIKLNELIFSRIDPKNYLNFNCYKYESQSDNVITDKSDRVSFNMDIKADISIKPIILFIKKNCDHYEIKPKRDLYNSILRPDIIILFGMKDEEIYFFHEKLKKPGFSFNILIEPKLMNESELNKVLDELL